MDFVVPLQTKIALEPSTATHIWAEPSILSRDIVCIIVYHNNNVGDVSFDNNKAKHVPVRGRAKIWIGTCVAGEVIGQRLAGLDTDL